MKLRIALLTLLALLALSAGVMAQDSVDRKSVV